MSLDLDIVCFLVVLLLLLVVVEVLLLDFCVVSEMVLLVLQGLFEDVVVVCDVFVVVIDDYVIGVWVYWFVGYRFGYVWLGLVFVYGGGWFQGLLVVYDNLCCVLVNVSGCVVIVMVYWLILEYFFLVLLEDVYVVLDWSYCIVVVFDVDFFCLLVGGDSVGGNFVVGVVLLVCDCGGLFIYYQLLLYLVLDMVVDIDSYCCYGEGYFFIIVLIQCCWEVYVGVYSLVSLYVVFVCVQDLIGLFVVSILVCDYDLLCDEGEYYVCCLQLVGVLVWCEWLLGMVYVCLYLLGVVLVLCILLDCSVVLLVEVMQVVLWCVYRCGGSVYEKGLVVLGFFCYISMVCGDVVRQCLLVEVWVD